MRKLLKFLFSRLVIVSLLLAVQLAFIVFLLTFLGQAQIYVAWALQIGSLAVVLWIISKQDNPSYKLAWCIPILMFPLFGGFFYLMFGNKRMSRKRTREIEAYALTQQRTFDDCSSIGRELIAATPMLYRQAEYITRISGFPVSRGTQAEYYPLGEDFMPALLAELEKAERFILMEYFIIEPGKMWDPILELLARKARAGVEVKLMYDDLGTIQILPAHYDKTMREMGLEVVVFNPLRPRLSSAMNYRDHRKITVVDGNVGFCGGINLADEYINAYPKHGHWKDTAVLLRGDAVQSLTLMFMHLWQFASNTTVDLSRYMPTASYPDDGFVQPFGDSPLDSFNVAENVYLQLINSAKRYIYITTPYLILDNEMVTALTMAAQSGIDVRIITPHVADKWYVHMVTQSYYYQLVEAGVQIFEYTPGFVHAKMVVCDDEVCMVGTTNMDYRSFYLHFECGIMFYRTSLVAEVKQDILQTLAVSEPITLSHSRTLVSRHALLRSILRVFAPLM